MTRFNLYSPPPPQKPPSRWTIWRIAAWTILFAMVGLWAVTLAAYTPDLPV